MGQHGQMQCHSMCLQIQKLAGNRLVDSLNLSFCLFVGEIRNWCASLGDMREIHTGMWTINILLIHSQCVYYCIWDRNVNDIACIIGL